MKRLSWKDWSKKHDKLYIAIVFVIGLAMGIGLGCQFILWKQSLQPLQRITMFVFELL